MNVILLKDVEKLGYANDVVTVKPGYGRNFLIPQGMAVIANAANKEKLDAELQRIEAEENARVDEFKALAAKLDGQKLNIGAKAAESGKIFGSVTNVQLAIALEEQLGVTIPRKKIVLDSDVKELGTYSAVVKFHKEVQTPIEFEVVRE